jgi:hypothetical protein
VAIERNREGALKAARWVAVTGYLMVWALGCILLMLMLGSLVTGRWDDGVIRVMVGLCIGISVGVILMRHSSRWVGRLVFLWGKKLPD